MKKLLLRAVGPLALMVALGAGMVQAAPQVGKPAPNFTGTTTAGKKLSLSQYKGKSAVLLNFYANF